VQSRKKSNCHSHTQDDTTTQNNEASTHLEAMAKQLWRHGRLLLLLLLLLAVLLLFIHHRLGGQQPHQLVRHLHRPLRRVEQELRHDAMAVFTERLHQLRQVEHDVVRWEAPQALADVEGDERVSEQRGWHLLAAVTPESPVAAGREAQELRHAGRRPVQQVTQLR